MLLPRIPMQEGPPSRSRVAARIAGLAVLKDVRTCAPAQRGTVTAKCRRAASQRARAPPAACTYGASKQPAVTVSTTPRRELAKRPPHVSGRPRVFHSLLTFGGFLTELPDGTPNISRHSRAKHRPQCRSASRTRQRPLSPMCDDPSGIRRRRSDSGRHTLPTFRTSS